MKYYRFASFLLTIIAKSSLQNDSTFTVSTDLVSIIDSSSLEENSTMTQLRNSEYSGLYSLGAVVFTPTIIDSSILHGYEVYDTGVFKTTLRELVEKNTSISGNNFMIYNNHQMTYFGFAVHVSPSSDGLPGAAPVVSPVTGTNVTVTYDSLSSQNVFYEMLGQNSGTRIPTISSRISVEGAGNVRIFAGCVTKLDEKRRIATIDSQNFGDFDSLQIKGRCRTYVLDHAKIQYYKEDRFENTYSHRIGQRGVIMSDTFPYSDTIDTWRNYLIQPIPNSGDIKVSYEFAEIGRGIQVHLQQYVHAMDSVNKTFTNMATSSIYESVSSYQQYLSFNSPASSDGVLIRYTVEKAADSVHTLLIFAALFTFSTM